MQNSSLLPALPVHLCLDRGDSLFHFAYLPAALVLLEEVPVLTTQLLLSLDDGVDPCQLTVLHLFRRNANLPLAIGIG